MGAYTHRISIKHPTASIRNKSAAGKTCRCSSNGCRKENAWVLTPMSQAADTQWSLKECNNKIYAVNLQMPFAIKYKPNIDKNGK